MNRVIRCQVRDEFVRGAGQVIGAAGSHDDVELELEFSGMWRGTSRRIVWFNALGEDPVLTVLGTDLLVPGLTETYRVPVPAEAKAVAGDMFCTIRGAEVENGAEKRAVVAATAVFRVLEAMWDPLAAESQDITPSQADQFQAQLDAIKDDISQAALAADAREIAQACARSAGESAQFAGDAMQRAEAAAGHYPYISDSGYWQLWNEAAGAWRNTGVYARGTRGMTGERGEPGPPGPAGPEGAPGVNGVAVSAEGFLAFNVTEEGVLTCTCTGDEAPGFYINGDGLLCLDLEENETEGETTI